MSKVILIQPKIGLYDKIGLRMPLALVTIAAYLDNVKIIDQRFPNWKKEILNNIHDCKLIGITCGTGVQIKYVLEICKLVKAHSNAKIVLGGSHPSLFPQQTIKNKYIDYVIAGEAELEILRLAKSLDKIPAKTILRSSEFIDINKEPPLPYKLLEHFSKYSSSDFRGKQTIDISTSRGCPYRCGFCVNTSVHKRMWRAKSFKKVKEELHRLIKEFNIKDFYFVDDEFFVDLKRAKQIITELKRIGDIRWGTNSIRADTVVRMDNDYIKLIYDSGCRELSIGVESGSNRILKLITKDETVDVFVEANKKLAKFPISIKYTFMIGFPTETKKEIFETVDLAKRLLRENKNSIIIFNTYCPYPGTPLWDLAKEYNLEIPSRLEDWINFQPKKWQRYYQNWNKKDIVKLCNNICFASLFYSKSMISKINNKLIKLLFMLYNPIAKFRFNYSFYNFYIEKLILGEME